MCVFGRCPVCSLVFCQDGQRVGPTRQCTCRNSDAICWVKSCRLRCGGKARLSWWSLLLLWKRSCTKSISQLFLLVCLTATIMQDMSKCEQFFCCCLFRLFHSLVRWSLMASWDVPTLPEVSHLCNLRRGEHFPSEETDYSNYPRHNWKWLSVESRPSIPKQHADDSVTCCSLQQICESEIASRLRFVCPKFAVKAATRKEATSPIWSVVLFNLNDATSISFHDMAMMQFLVILSRKSRLFRISLVEASVQ